MWLQMLMSLSCWLTITNKKIMFWNNILCNQHLFDVPHTLLKVLFQSLYFRSSARSLTTTLVIDSKNGDVGSPSGRGSKKTFTDDLYSTFSSPLAWILVMALIITWSCVFVIMFDLTDYKTISGTERLFALSFLTPGKTYTYNLVCSDSKCPDVA